MVNLFTIGASKDKKEKDETKPFIHQVQFHRPQGEIVRVWANIDNGAMKEVMSSFEKRLILINPGYSHFFHSFIHSFIVFTTGTYFLKN